MVVRAPAFKIFGGALYSSPGWLSGLVVNMQASSKGQRPSVRFRAVGCRLGFVVQELRFRTHHSQTVPHAFRLHSTRQTMSDEDYGVFSGCLAICPLIPKTRTLNRVCRPGVGQTHSHSCGREAQKMDRYTFLFVGCWFLSWLWVFVMASDGYI